MRVLHVHSGNLFGGIETTMILQSQHRRLCPSIELHFALCFEGRLSQGLEETGVPIYRLGNVRLRYPFAVRRARLRLKQLLRTNQFDVVITHSGWTHAIFGPVIRAAGVPLVTWIHGLDSGRRWLDRLAFRTRPDLVLCNSYFVSQSLTSQLRQSPSHVFYNPKVIYYPMTTASDRFVPAEVDRQKVRKQLNTPSDATVIVQVSRLESWKGHELLFASLSLIKDIPGWVCWEVGGVQRPQEKRYLRKLKQMAIDLQIADRVLFLGERRDVSRLLQAADIHCQPNTGPEPFGNTFIEGLVNQLPVVTTAIGGAREIIDESCGILVPPDDPGSLANCLADLIRNPIKRRQLGSRGPARARDLCDLETQMKNLHGLLSDHFCMA